MAHFAYEVAWIRSVGPIAIFAPIEAESDIIALRLELQVNSCVRFRPAAHAIFHGIAISAAFAGPVAFLADHARLVFIVPIQTSLHAGPDFDGGCIFLLLTIGGAIITANTIVEAQRQ